MTKAKKPPTQVAGVVGIEPLPVHESPESEPAIDWLKVLALPAFQMFAVEIEPNLKATIGKTDSNAEQVMFTWLKQYKQDELYAEYCQWHENKGYWPNETPLGELKEGA